MIHNERPGSFNATILSLWPKAAAIAPYESEGVYYALIGGNHVMHFRQSYWKKQLRGAINGYSMYISSNNVLIAEQEGQVTNGPRSGSQHSIVRFWKDLKAFHKHAKYDTLKVLG